MHILVVEVCKKPSQCSPLPYRCIFTHLHYFPNCPTHPHNQQRGKVPPNSKSMIFFTWFLHFDHVNPWLKTRKNLFPFSQRLCFLLLNLCLFIVPQYIPMESNNELHLIIIYLMIYLKFCSSSKVWVSMLKWLLTFSLEVQPVRIMKGEYLMLA